MTRALSSPVQGRSRTVAYSVGALYAVCGFIHLLLPVQTGFPTLGPIHVTSLALGFTILALAVMRPYVLQTALQDRYTAVLIAFAVLATFMTYAVNGRSGMYEGWEQLPLVATNAVAGYVVNLAAIRIVGIRPVFRTLLILASVAGLLTLLEGIFAYRLPPYEAVLLLQLSRGVDLFSSRAVGPLGNSLITSLQLSLLALIAMAECRGAWRVAIVLLAVSGSLLTGSKTSLIIVPAIIYIEVVHLLRDPDFRHARVKLILSLALLAGAAGGFLSAGPKTPIIGTMYDRIVGSQKDLSDLGAEIRQNALIRLGYDELLGDPKRILFGYGAGAAGDEMKKVQGNNTVDNMYLAVAYDYGIPTALVFLAGLFGPFTKAWAGTRAIPYYITGGMVIAFYGLSFNTHLVTTVMFMITAFAARCRVEVPA